MIQKADCGSEAETDTQDPLHRQFSFNVLQDGFLEKTEVFYQCSSTNTAGERDSNQLWIEE